MKLLIASSSVGLGHVTRDYALAEAIKRINANASIEWLTAEPALGYLKARGVNLSPLCRELESISKAFEEAIIDGKLRLLKSLPHVLSAVRRNCGIVRAGLDADDYDLIVADEFWEFLLTPVDHGAFITDFLSFKPVRFNPLERALVWYGNRKLWKLLRRARKVVYVGLRKPSAEKLGYSFRGQIVRFKRGAVRKEPRDGLRLTVMLGGTKAGAPLAVKAKGAIEKLRGGCEVEWKVFCNEELAKKLFNLSYPAEFNPDPYRWLVESDAVITLAGLSSLVELAYLKKRAIIAYIANDFEQMGNALEFEGREGYRVFNLSRVEATDLQAALIGILREEPKPPSVKDASNEIAKEILETNTRN